MRFLGIDYGTKRIGLAISDDSGRIAFPKEIVKNDSTAVSRIGSIIKDERIEGVVIGESSDLNGNDNTIQGKIKSFANELKQLSLVEVVFQKEFMTSVEARRTKIFKKDRDQTGASSRVKKDVGEKVDAKAAMLILQRYLDKRNIKGNLN